MRRDHYVARCVGIVTAFAVVASSSAAIARKPKAKPAPKNAASDQRGMVGVDATSNQPRVVANNVQVQLTKDPKESSEPSPVPTPERSPPASTAPPQEPPAPLRPLPMTQLKELPNEKHVYEFRANELLLELTLPGTPPPVEAPKQPPTVLPWQVPWGVAPDDPFVDVVAVGRGSGFDCTGVVVSPRVVLTARHCLPAARVLIGNDVRQPSLTVRVVRSVVPTAPADVAALVLEQALSVVARPRRALSNLPAPYGPLRLVGFGRTDVSGSTGFGVKRYIDVTAVGWGCDGERAAAMGCAPDSELVLPRSGGGDTCDGDSGGPVFERSAQGLRLIALTSRPIPGMDLRCGDGGIYTRIDSFDRWIQSVIASTEGGIK